MPKAVSILSPFHNVSAGDLVDQLGALKAEIAALEDREKSLRDELIRRGVSEARGALFGASVTQAIRWTLNTAAIKSEMGLPWYDDDERERRCDQMRPFRDNIEAIGPATLAGVLAMLDLGSDLLSEDPHYWPNEAIEGLRDIAAREGRS